MDKERWGREITSATLVGKGCAFGTFGELLQGVLLEEELDFLVTFPITRRSCATFTSDPDLATLQVFPPTNVKVKKLAGVVLEHYRLPQGGVLEIDSDIPEGKGLASSSSDLVATARAIDQCFGLQMKPEDVEQFLVQIEPTDGVMYPGVVSYYHRKVRLREFLGPLPRMTVVSVDEGGEVDTIEFNKIPKPFSEEEMQEYTNLLQLATEGVRNGDVETIGQVGTRSAVLNQALRPKSCLNDLIALCEQVGGLGVLVAHSGTCIGILLSQQAPNYPGQLNNLYQIMEKRYGQVMTYESWRPEDEEMVWDEQEMQLKEG